MKLLLQFLTLLIFMCAPRVGGYSEVRTSSGLVEGTDILTTWGRVTIFLGIPYAEPPLGKNRFMPSKGITLPRRVPGPPSNDTEDRFGYNVMSDVKVNSGGSILPPACPQFPDSPEQANATSLWRDEDCLKLNIYVPSNVDYNRNTEKLPVLVYVPGYNFTEAHSGLFDGSAMAALDRIIVVTLNYRVGVFGYLSTGNSSLPGNAAISDILSALDWIRANGDSFGMNLTRITVAGTFHGSVTLSAVVTSPKFIKKEAKMPLAQQVIFHGGISSGPWSIEDDPLQPFLKLAGLCDCLPNGSIEDAIECLQKIPVRDLLVISERVPEVWRPTIDGVFVKGNPLELIEYGRFPDDIDVLIGENAVSGSFCIMNLSPKKPFLASKILNDTLNEEDLENLIADDLQEFFKVNDEILSAVVTHEYLFPGTSIPEPSLRSTYQHFCGTLFIRNPSELAARYLSRFNSHRVFRYEFDFRYSLSNYPDWMGSAVGDEGTFLFPVNGTIFPGYDYRVFEDFRGSWTNFVKYGSPSIINGTWPEFDEDTKKMMVFTKLGMKLDTSRFLDRDVHFWRQTVAPLLQSLEEGRFYKNPEVLRKHCTDQCPKQPNIVNLVLIFLMFLGICVLFGLAFYVYLAWRKHNRLFN